MGGGKEELLLLILLLAMVECRLAKQLKVEGLLVNVHCVLIMEPVLLLLLEVVVLVVLFLSV